MKQGFSVFTANSGFTKIVLCMETIAMTAKERSKDKPQKQIKTFYSNTIYETFQLY